MPQPVINLEEAGIESEGLNQIKSFSNFNKTPLEKASEAFDAFLRIQKKKEYSDVEKRLLKTMDTKIKKCFDLIA